MFKKILIPILLLLFLGVKSQYNNAWISYSKTYYKFKLAQDGLCRIPFSTLNAIGIANNNVRYFQLWRNGQEVRIYTSVSSGVLGPNDFIEFYGLMNDGKPDNELYRDPDFQIADRYSLETDTVSYFLTLNSSNSNLRYTNMANNAPGSMVPDAYYMRSMDYYYKSSINQGEAKLVGEYVHSSSYDKGEGWASDQISPGTNLLKEFTNLNVYQNGPVNGLSLRVNMAGASANDRNVSIKLFQTDISSSPYSSPINMPYFEYRKIAISNLPISLLQSNSYLPVSIVNNATNNFDRMVVSSVGITYPAKFNFSNATDVSFTLNPSGIGNYLIIDSFNFGNALPVLYDESSGNRFLGDTASTRGKVRFVLPGSALVRKMRLSSQALIYNVLALT